MTRKEILTAYRTAVLDLHELMRALERVGSNGQPRGLSSIQLEALPGTNNAGAAALQAAEGIEEMIRRKREELAILAGPVGALMAVIGDPKTFIVIRGYYVEAESDADIARNLCMSRCRVNQIRNSYLAQAS